MAITLPTTAPASKTPVVTGSEKSKAGTKLKIHKDTGVHDDLANVTDEFAQDVEEPEPEVKQEAVESKAERTYAEAKKEAQAELDADDFLKTEKKEEPARVESESDKPAESKAEEPTKPAKETKQGWSEEDELEFRNKRRAAEHDHLAELQTARETYTNESLKQMDLEVTLKTQKDAVKGLLKGLKLLTDRGPNYPTRDKKQQTLPFDKKSETKAAETGSKPVAGETKAPVSETKPAQGDSKVEVIVDADWREIPTAKILDGIKGLGPKKHDAIIHAYPTLGKLEDARDEMSKEHLPFNKALPAGVGAGAAQSIENNMMDAIAKIRTEKDSKVKAK